VQKSIQFRVELEGIQPAICRTFQVDHGEDFFQLHEILQIVMGWENAHLFEFRLNGRRIGLLPDEDELWDADENVEDSEAIVLGELGLKEGDEITYIYDFGDEWVHKLTVERLLPQETPTPICLAGSRNCPPEDCGGIFGYVHLLEVLRNPKHPEFKEFSEWVEEFDPELFDLEETNEILKEFDDWRESLWDEEE